MAKLKAPAAAGFNAGFTNHCRMVKLGDIIIDSGIAKLFKINDIILDEIKQKMEKTGFDKSQPLTVAIVGGKKFLVDGRTRYTAAKEAGLAEVPVFEMEFPDFDSALMYTFERQAIRRNLTGAEILTAAMMMKGPKVKDGTGRAAEQLAKKLGVGPATIYKARRIAEKASEDVVKAVQSGAMSLRAGYNTTAGTNDHIPKTIAERAAESGGEFDITDARGLPANVKFLKAAVELLFHTNMEFSRITAIHILINHFIRKKERAGFLKLLRADVRGELDDESKPKTVFEAGPESLPDL